MKLPITIEIIKKTKWYLARIPELDFVSQGRTLEEAKRNVLETLRIQLVEMRTVGMSREQYFELLRRC